MADYSLPDRLIEKVSTTLLILTLSNTKFEITNGEDSASMGYWLMRHPSGETARVLTEKDSGWKLMIKESIEALATVLEEHPYQVLLDLLMPKKEDPQSTKEKIPEETKKFLSFMYHKQTGIGDRVAVDWTKNSNVDQWLEKSVKALDIKPSAGGNYKGD